MAGSMQLLESGACLNQSCSWPLLDLELTGTLLHRRQWVGVARLATNMQHFRVGIRNLQGDLESLILVAQSGAVARLATNMQRYWADFFEEELGPLPELVYTQVREEKLPESCLTTLVHGVFGLAMQHPA